MSSTLSRLKQTLAQKGATPVPDKTDKSPPAPEKGAGEYPTKPTEAPFVSFVSDPGTPFLENGFEERAAIIEHGGGIPQPYADALAAVICAGKPADVPEARWRRFQNDAARLCDGWAEKALSLGWSTTDLLGVDAIAPMARLDRMGLAWVLEGGEVIAVTSDLARIRCGQRVYSVQRPRREII